MRIAGVCGFVKGASTGRTAAMVGLHSGPCGKHRRGDQHPKRTNSYRKLTEQGITLSLGVDRTDTDHDIGMRTHPLADQRTMGLVRGEPEARRTSR